MTSTDSITGARQVIEALQRLRADAPGLPDESLGRADAIVAPVPALLQRLAGHFIDVPYPTPEFALKAMRMATDLCVEVIRTFHHLLSTRSQLSWLNLQLHKGHWPALAQRVFYFGYHLAFVRRIAGQPALVPAGALLIDVIRESVDHHWLDASISSSLAGSHGTFPPRHFLHRMALVSVAPLDEVRVHQIEEITRIVVAWADAVKVRVWDGSEARAVAEGELLRIELGEVGQGAVGSGGGTDLAPALVVDLRTLGDRLFQGLAAAGGDPPRVQIGKGLEVDVSTLETLRDLWRLPEPHKKHFLDSDAEMATWVRALPVANPRECTRLIYGELDGLRRLRAPPERKFAFLEGLAAPIQVVLNHLRQRIGEPEFPLSERVLRLGTLCYEVCTLVMDGYEEVMEYEGQGAWLAGKAVLDRRILAAHRILYYGYRAIFIRKTLGLGMEEHFWITVHQAFKLAVGKERFGQTCSLSAIEDYGDRSFVLFYKMIILASLLPMQQLRASQLREVAETLEEWAKEAELAFCSADSHLDGAVVRLRPDEDAGPRWDTSECTGCSRGYCLLLSSSILLTRLTHLARAAGHAPDAVAPLRISLDTLEFLLDAWAERKERSEDRQAVNAPLEALFSVTGIHRFLTDGEGGASTKQVAGDKHRPKEQMEVENEIILHDRKGDVWDYIYNWQELGEANWAEQTSPGPITFQRVRILDKSKHGCRLAVEPGPGAAIRTGDLLAMRKVGGTSLYVGYVRWARNAEDGRVELGIKFIMSQAEARNAVVEADQRKTKRLPCLIGRYVSRARPLIVVPFIPDLPRKNLVIEEGGAWVPVLLVTPPLDHSRSFEAYEWRRSNRGKAPEGESEPARRAWDYL